MTHSDLRLAVSESFKRLDPPFYPFLSALQWVHACWMMEHPDEDVIKPGEDLTNAVKVWLTELRQKSPNVLGLADNGDTLGASKALIGLIGPPIVHAKSVFHNARTVATALDEELKLRDPDAKLERTGDGASIWLLAGVGAVLMLLGSRK